MATLSPGVDFWDTGEMQTVPYVLGIAHPTGFPVFVLGGFAFAHLLPVGSPAWRLSLFSALASAGAAWLLFVFARDVTGDVPVALAGAWTFALGDVVWTRAVRAEVHDLALFFAALAFVMAARAGRTRSGRDLAWAAAACGLGLATHPVVALAGPAYLVLAWPAAAAAGAKGRLIALAALAFPLAAYAYVPLRSGYVEAHAVDPVLALGLRGGAIFDYGAPATPGAFLRYVTGAAFQPAAALQTLATGTGLRRVAAVSWAVLSQEYGLVMLTLAGAGFAYLALFRRRAAVAAAAVLVGAVLFVPNYEAESDYARYGLCALWVLSACAACGARWVMTAIAGPGPGASVLAGGMLVVALWPAAPVAARDVRRLAAYEDARAIGPEIVRRTADGSLVVASWTFATPLAYEAYVAGSFGRRRLLSGWPYDYAGRYGGWRARFKHVYFVIGPGYAWPGFMRPLYGNGRWQLAELR